MTQSESHLGLQSFLSCVPPRPATVAPQIAGPPPGPADHCLVTQPVPGDSTTHDSATHDPGQSLQGPPAPGLPAFGCVAPVLGQSHPVTLAPLVLMCHRGLNPVMWDWDCTWDSTHDSPIPRTGPPCECCAQRLRERRPLSHCRPGIWSHDPMEGTNHVNKNTPDKSPVASSCIGSTVGCPFSPRPSAKPARARPNGHRASERAVLWDCLGPAGLTPVMWDSMAHVGLNGSWVTGDSDCFCRRFLAKWGGFWNCTDCNLTPSDPTDGAPLVPHSLAHLLGHSHAFWASEAGLPAPLVPLWRASRARDPPLSREWPALAGFVGLPWSH